MIREKVYEYKDFLEIGEKLIVLKNNPDTGLMNGSIVDVLAINYEDSHEGIAEVLIQDDTGLKQNIEIDTDILKGIEEKPKRFAKEEGIHEVDYAYAVTCHKAQGSEFENVFVINQGQHHDDYVKWYYTAVTRARKKLYIYN